jgi:hypothetical protein
MCTNPQQAGNMTDAGMSLALAALQQGVDTSIRLCACRSLATAEATPSNVAMLVTTGAMSDLATAAASPDASLSVAACAALGRFTTLPGAAKAAVEAGALVHLCVALRAHPIAAAVAAGALVNLTRNSAHQQAAVKARMPVLLVAAMVAAPRDLELQVNGCCAIVNMTCSDALARASVPVANMADALLEAARAHPENASVAGAVCAGLRNLAGQQESTRDAVLDAGAMEVVCAALAAHREDPCVQRNGFSAFARLLCESSCATASAHGALDDAIEALRCARVEEAVVAGAGVLCLLTEVPRLARRAVEAGAFAALLAAAERESGRSAQSQCAGALSNLVLSPLFRRAALDAGVPRALVRALELHPSDPAVASDALNGLASLTEGSSCSPEVEAALLLALDAGVPGVLAPAMKTHAKLRSAGTLLAAQISMTPAAARPLVQSGTLREVCVAMSSNAKHANTQENGCVVLFNVALESEYEDEAVSLGGISLVLASLKEHATNDGVVERACAALDVLVRTPTHRAIATSAGALEELASVLAKRAPCCQGVAYEALFAARDLCLSDDSVADPERVARLYAALEEHRRCSRRRDAPDALVATLLAHGGTDRIVACTVRVVDLVLQTDAANSGFQRRVLCAFERVLRSGDKRLSSVTTEATKFLVERLRCLLDSLARDAARSMVRPTKYFVFVERPPDALFFVPAGRCAELQPGCRARQR